MKKSLLALLTVLFLCSGNTYALEFYLDLNNVGGGALTTSGDGITDLMSQISLVQSSEILQDATGAGGVIQINDDFTESGVGQADGFTGAADDEGLSGIGSPDFYEMTFSFENLAGDVSDIIGSYVFFDFDYAGSANIFVDNSNNASPELQVGIGDSPIDPNTATGYDDGIQIAELLVTGGSGFLDLATGQGVTYLDLQFVDDSAYYDTWYTDANVDMVKDLASLTVALVDSTQLNFEIDPVYPTGGTTVYDIGLTGNGGFRPSVVPEPATMTLFGLGLLGVAGISRRRKK